MIFHKLSGIYEKHNNNSRYCRQSHLPIYHVPFIPRLKKILSRLSFLLTVGVTATWATAKFHMSYSLEEDSIEHDSSSKFALRQLEFDEVGITHLTIEKRSVFTSFRDHPWSKLEFYPRHAVSNFETLLKCQSW